MIHKQTNKQTSYTVRRQAPIYLRRSYCHCCLPCKVYHITRVFLQEFKAPSIYVPHFSFGRDVDRLEYRQITMHASLLGCFPIQGFTDRNKPAAPGQARPLTLLQSFLK